MTTLHYTDLHHLKIQLVFFLFRRSDLLNHQLRFQTLQKQLRHDECESCGPEDSDEDQSPPHGVHVTGTKRMQYGVVPKRKWLKSIYYLFISGATITSPVFCRQTSAIRPFAAFNYSNFINGEGWLGHDHVNPFKYATARARESRPCTANAVSTKTRTRNLGWYPM